MTVIPDNAQHIGAREEQQDSFGFPTWSKPSSFSMAARSAW
jgi:hypothetical protein